MATNQEKKLATARAKVEALVAEMHTKLTDDDVSEESFAPFIQEATILQDVALTEVTADINTAITTFTTAIDKLFSELTVEPTVDTVELERVRALALEAIKSADIVMDAPTSSTSDVAKDTVTTSINTLTTLIAGDDINAIVTSTEAFYVKLNSVVTALQAEAEQASDVASPVESESGPVTEVIEGTVISNRPKHEVPAVNVLVDIFERYAHDMLPSRIQTTDTIIVSQTALYNAIVQTLKLDGPAFTDTLNTLLSIIEENKKLAFSPYTLYRGFEHLKLNRDQRRFFERILNLFTTTSNPVTRNTTIKQVDVAATLEGIRDEQMSQKVISFYGQ